MTLVELLYARLQLLGKCVKLDWNYQETCEHVVTRCLTPMEGVTRIVKTDLAGQPSHDFWLSSLK